MMRKQSEEELVALFGGKGFPHDQIAIQTPSQAHLGMLFFSQRETVAVFEWSGSEGHISSDRHLLKAHLFSPGRYYPLLHSVEFADLIPF